MQPPDLPWQSKRRHYTETPLEQTLSRQNEIGQMADLLAESVTNPHSDTKRLIFVEGDAGIGKSWFLYAFLQQVKEKEVEWRVLEPFEARQFVAQNPYAEFIKLMNECAGRPLVEINQAQVVTQEDVIRCAEMLHLELVTRTEEPLLLVFDELEWWVDIDSQQREYLNTLFRIVWRVLLRQYTMPCIIICAGRRAPEFKDVLLKRTLHTMSLAGFTSDELHKLVLPQVLNIPQAVVEIRAAGNPWIIQLLHEVHLNTPDALADSAKKEKTLRWLFEQVVEDRFDPVLRQTLYSLARFRPDGFYPEDELLPEGDATIYKLVRTSFIEFDTDSRRYRVAPVLSSLLKE